MKRIGMGIVGAGFVGPHHIDAVRRLQSAMKFRGKLSADGQKIEGTFSQSGANLPCSLERKADPATVAKTALEGFDAEAADSLKKFDVPGLAIAIVKGGEVIYAKGFGYRDVEKKLPVTADTLSPSAPPPRPSPPSPWHPGRRGQARLGQAGAHLPPRLPALRPARRPR